MPFFFLVLSKIQHVYFSMLLTYTLMWIRYINNSFIYKVVDLINTYVHGRESTSVTRGLTRASPVILHKQSTWQDYLQKIWGLPEKRVDFALTSVNKLHFGFPQLGCFFKATKLWLWGIAEKTFSLSVVHSFVACVADNGTQSQNYIAASLSSNAPESETKTKYLEVTKPITLCFEFEQGHILVPNELYTKSHKEQGNWNCHKVTSHTRTKPTWLRQ